LRQRWRWHYGRFSLGRALNTSPAAFAPSLGGISRNRRDVSLAVRRALLALVIFHVGIGGR
jgi:hypothetical protein